MINNKFKQGEVNRIKLPVSTGSWLTKAGKSLGIAAFDVIQDTIPATAELIENTQDYITNFKQHMEDFKTQQVQLNEIVDKNVLSKVRAAAKNAVTDLKAGNLYTPMSQTDSDDFDFDLGDDWDVGDDGDYDADFSSEDGTTKVRTKSSKLGDTDVTSVKVNVDVGQNSALIKATERQTKAYVDAQTATVAVSKTMSANVLRELEGISSSLTSFLGSIDSNVSTITTTTTSMSQVSSAALKYFDDSMKVFGEINETLKLIHQNATTPNGIGGEPNDLTKVTDVLDIFSANGMLDFGAYKNLVLKQLDKYSDSNLVLSMMKNIMSNEDVLEQMIAHPLNMVTESLMKGIITPALRAAASEFDNTLKGAMTAGLYRVRNLVNSDNPILRALGQVFGIGNKMQTSVDKANYNRGKVDWNGTSHKTLNEVIPYYLRKITAALTGTRETAFDYDKGIFRNLGDIQKDYKDDHERRQLGELSTLVSDFKSLISENEKYVIFNNQLERDKMSDEFKNFMLKLVRTDGMPLKLNDNSFKKSIADFSGRSTDDTFVQLASAMLDTRSRSELMDLFGRGMLNTRVSYDKYIKQEENGEHGTNGMYTNAGFGVDETMRKDAKGNIVGVDYSKSFLGTRDKYGRSSVDYLRDITKMIATGIRVYNIGDGGSSSRRRGRGGISTSPVNDITKVSDGILRGFDTRSREYDYADSAERRNALGRETSLDTRTRLESQGAVHVDDDGRMKAEILTAAIKDRQRQEEEPIDRITWFNKVTGINPDQPLSKLLNKFNDILKKPSILLTDLFKKSDELLFRIIFGDNLTAKGNLFDKTKSFFKKTFADFSKFLNDKVLSPLNEAMFGEKGLITQIKNSKFGQDMSKAMGRVREYMFGTYNKETQKYEGGMFSDVATELSAAGRNIKEALIGENEGSVLSNIKAAGSSVMTNIAEMVGYDIEEARRKRQDPNYSPIKDTLDTVWSTVKSRTKEFMDNVLGPDDGNNPRREFLKSFNKDMQSTENLRGKLGAGALIGGASAAFLSGKLGFVSSLFLPGGFIGGALAGLGITVVSNSETLKKFLFGEKGGEDTDGRRQGGFISKSIIDFWEDNKTGIKIGGFTGLAAALGIIPAFFMPGGPIGGALIGGALQMAYNTDNIQEFLYGPVTDPATGERASGQGFLRRVKSAMGSDTIKGKLLDAGIGAGVGFLGSFFLPGGPILGALLGAGVSMTVTSEKFKSFLFGEKDEETGKRSGGLIAKATNYLLGPLRTGLEVGQAKLFGWMERNIMSPFMTAIKPILEEVRRVKDRIVNAFNRVVTGIVESFKEHVTRPIGNFFKENLIDPMTKIVKFMMSGFRKLSGLIISSPFKVMQMIGYSANAKHMRQGVKEHVSGTVSAVADLFGLSRKLKQERAAEGKTITFREKLSNVRRYIDPENFGNSRFSDAGAYYNRELGISSKKEHQQNVEESKAWEEYQIDWARNRKKYEAAGLKKKTRAEFDAEGVDGKTFRNWTKTTKPTYKKPAKDKIETTNIDSASTSINATTVTINTTKINDVGTSKKTKSSDDNTNPTKLKVSRPIDTKLVSSISSSPAIAENGTTPSGNSGIPLSQWVRSASNKAKSMLKGAGGMIKPNLHIGDSSNDENIGETDNKTSRKSFATKRGSAITGIAANIGSGVGKIRSKLQDAINVYVVGGNLDSIGRTKHQGNFAFGRFFKKKSGADARLVTVNDDEAIVNAKNEIEYNKEAAPGVTKVSNKEAEDALRRQKEAELAANNARKSYESQKEQAAEQEKLKREKDNHTFLSTLVERVESIGEGLSKHHAIWGKIFSKKGLITAAVLAASPMIIKLVDWFINWENNPIAKVINNIRDSINSVGEMADRAKNLGGRFVDLLGFGDDEGTIGQRLSNFIFPVDENGEQQYTNTSGAFLNVGKQTGIKIAEKTGQQIAKGGQDDLLVRLFSKLKSAPEKGRNLLRNTVTQAGKIKTFVGDAGREMSTKFDDVDKLIIRASRHGGNDILDSIDTYVAKHPNVAIDEDAILERLIQYGGSLDIDTIRSALFANAKSNSTPGVRGILKGALGIPKSVTSSLSSTYSKALGQTNKFVESLPGIGKPTAALNRTLGNMGNTVTDVANYVGSGARSVGKAGGEIAVDVGKAAMNLGRSAVTGVKTAGTKVKDVASGLYSGSKLQKGVSAVGNVATQTVDNVKSFATKESDRITALIAKLFDWLKDGFVSLLKKFGIKDASKLTSKLTALKKFFSPAVIAKNMPKLTQAVTVGGIKTTPLGLLAVAGGTLAGAMNASNLFQVDQSVVDTKMKAISAVFGGLRNAGILGSLADVLNEIAFSISDVNIFTEIAYLVYSLISSKEDREQLDAAKDAFRQKYDKKILEEYNALSDEDKMIVDEETGETRQMTLEEFKNSDKSTSFADFNAQQHQTVGAKVFNAFKNMRNSEVGTTTVFKKDYWAVDTLNEDGTEKTAEQIAKEKSKKILMAPLVLIRGVFTDVVKTLGSVVDMFKSTISTFGKNTKDMFSKITGVGSVFSDEVWAKPETGGDENTQALSDVAFYANRIIMTLPALAVGIGKDVGKTLGKLWDKVQLVVGALAGDSEDAFANITGIGDVFSGKYWTAPTEDDDGNPMSPLRRAVFYGSRALTFIPALAVGAARSIGNVFEPVITPIKNLIKRTFNLEDKEPDVDDEDDLGNVHSFAWYVAKGLSFMGTTIQTVGKTVGKILKPVAKGVSFTVKSIAEDLITFVETTDSPLAVFTGQYWTPPQAQEGDEWVALRNAMFFGSRILTVPFTVPVGILKKALGYISPITHAIGTTMKWGMEDMVSAATVVTDPLKIFSGEYWSAPTDEDGSPVSGLRRLMFYSNRISGIIPFTVVGAVRWVGSKLAKVFSKFIEAFPKIKTDMATAFDLEGTSIFDSGFWKYDETGDDDMSDGAGGIRKIMFYGARMISAIPRLVTAVFNTGKGIFATVTDMFANLGNTVDKAFDTDNIKITDNYFKTNAPTDMSNPLTNVLFVIGRVLAAIPWIVNKIVNKAKSFGLIDTLGDLFRKITGSEDDSDQASSGTTINGSFASRGGMGGDDPDIMNGFVYYSQNDPDLKNKPYKTSTGVASGAPQTIGARGCGPTALSMVATQLNSGSGNPYSPENLANIATRQRYSTNNGTIPQYFTEVGPQLGMNVTPANPSADTLQQFLMAGKPVILQGRSDSPTSPYTSAGHYVVAVGYDDNGNVLINDPRGRNYSHAYSVKDVLASSGGMWAFDKASSVVGTGLRGFRFKSKKLGGFGTQSFYFNQADAAYTNMTMPDGSTIGEIGCVLCSVAMGISNCVGRAISPAEILRDHPYLFDKNSNIQWGQIPTVAKAYGAQAFKVTSFERVKELLAKGYPAVIYGRKGTDRVVGRMGRGGYTTHAVLAIRYDEATKKVLIDDPGARDRSGTWVDFTISTSDFGYKGFCYIFKKADGSAPSVTSTTNPESASTDSTASTSTSTIGVKTLSSIMSQFATELVSPLQQKMFGTTSSDSSTTGTTVSTSGITSKSGASTDQIKQAIWNYLRNNGFSEQAAAAVMGNMYVESGGFNLNALGDNGTSLGLCQWHAGRKTALENKAASMGLSPDSLDAQLAYLMDELNGKETTFISLISDRYGSVNGFKSSTGNVSTLTKDFMETFERPGISHLDKRVSAANDIYNAYAGSAGMGGGSYKPTSTIKSSKGGTKGLVAALAAYRAGMQDPRKIQPVDMRYSGMGDNTYRAMQYKVSRSQELSDKTEEYKDNTKMEQLLSDILIEMRGANSGINKFNDKELSVTTNPVVYTDNSQKNVVVPQSTPPSKTVKNPRQFLNTTQYAIAKKIASGVIYS